MDVRGGLVLHYVRAASPRSFVDTSGETTRDERCARLFLAPGVARLQDPMRRTQHLILPRAPQATIRRTARLSASPAHRPHSSGPARMRPRQTVMLCLGHAPARRPTPLGWTPISNPRRGWSSQGHRGSGAGAATRRATAAGSTPVTRPGRVAARLKTTFSSHAAGPIAGGSGLGSCARGGRSAVSVARPSRPSGPCDRSLTVLP
jgi:hypothetical protein